MENENDFFSRTNESANQLMDLCNEDQMGPKRDSLGVIIPIIIIYLLIFLTGTIGNISTCIVISRNKSMHTATNYYLFSLAISDLLLLFSGLPQEIYSIYSRYPYIFGSAFCFLRGMFAETSANATVLTITAFTVERYLAICHPFLSHTMSKLSRAVKLILAIWLVAIVLAIPQAMQFKIVGDEGCEECRFVEPIIEHSFELSTFLFFVLPMTLITVLYVLIGVRLKSSSMIKKRAGGSTRVQSKSSRKVVKMLVSVVVAFFICWAPFHAQRLYWSYSTNHDADSHSFYLKIYEIVTYISGILYYMSATINPILYNIMSVKFREAFKETFTRCCGFKSTRPQRSYSVLSRSAQRGPDSTDSGRDDPTIHTHTTLTHKSSIESFNGIHHNKRNKNLSQIQGVVVGIEEETPVASDMEWTLNELNDNDDDNNSESLTISKLNGSNPPNRKFIAITINQNRSHGRFEKFLQYFECIAKRTLDDRSQKPKLAGQRAYYTSPVKEPSILLELEVNATAEAALGSARKKEQCLSPCDISNSSLRDIESGAIEDELTIYMKEVKQRECYS